ncbi:winged helix DNA-binding protein [Oceanicella sp. SM1341]|uniref:winged helix DNA-binding protein n=1 Tax=Oceanicella sp. SM1341 TaxID=1548889 RepID=UPI0013007FF2|nr:winged helix DNA-binding protein [Oceanicella sp. SM1341]
MPPEHPAGEMPAEAERGLADFEFALWHLGAAFARWRRDCFAAVCDLGLGGTEASILHVVHMNDTAKGLSEIGRILHRDDHTNLQYGVKKLLRLGLLEKRGAARKTMTYGVSPRGREIVEAYLAERRRTLLRLYARMAPVTGELSETTTLMHLLSGVYDQASDLVINHQPE